MMTSYNPAELPQGPRPPELIDDPLEVALDEATEIAERAIAQMVEDSKHLEGDDRGLRR